MMPISKISILRAEENAVLRVLRSGVLTQGREIAEFEKEFAAYIGVRESVAVSNGSVALHAALIALGIGSGDEVITTPFSFIAPANAILNVGAKPVFVDVLQNFNIAVSKIEEKITSRTKAIIPVHLYGNPCDMDKIIELARTYKLKIVEDACQSHGAEYKRKKVGAFGHLACFSFYATKNMTTGEGGMITTNDKTLAQRLRMLRSHGSKVRYYHKFLGYNFRLTEMQAAIGRVQLARLDISNDKRIRNAYYLSKLLQNVPGIILPSIEKSKKHVFHQYTIILTEKFSVPRSKVLDYLDKRAIGYGIYYPVPIHKQEEFIKMGFRDNLPTSESLSKNVISLPIHPGVTKKDLHDIADVIQEVVKSWNKKRQKSI